MSFILDALKKSESDRQRQSGPSLFEVKVAPPRRTLPVWAVAIAALLGINVIVISWMLLRRGPAQQPAPASTPAAAPAPAPAPARAAAPTPAPAPATTAAGAGAANRTATAKPTPPATAPASSGAGAAAEAFGPASGQPPAQESQGDQAPAAGAPSAQGAETPAAAGGALPLYQQIVTSAGLPALHLDLHVYAPDPKDRFAMIDMHKVVEGDTMANGVHVDAIRPDGVVLSYHGTRFLLPRG